jgi:acyl-CoA synthetase (AMP-forming)/AMP-acid ligase II
VTYQAGSGGGAKNMRERGAQRQESGGEARDGLENPSASALTLDKNVIDTMRGSQFPVENFGAPLAGNVLPWIDKEMENGQSREEWKGIAETNKILGTDTLIPVDGICVRMGSMRCHSQALTIKLKKDISVEDIEKIVDENNKTLRADEKAEIVLGGPCIMKGYYKNPKATDAVIRTDGNGVRWLHTGDLGYLDEDGYLYITVRKKYLIILPGGKNVNPEIVESVLSQSQFVEEILVVPGLQKDSAERTQEAIRAIVRPAWDAIQADTRFSYPDLVEQPQVLKKLVWQNINECQQRSRQLSGFEKVSSQNLEIRIDEFHKTSTGKIKRDLYINIPQK